MQNPGRSAELRCERVHGGAATPEGGIMADTSQPSFAMALAAVLAGGAISSLISETFVGLAPTTNIEVWAILTSVVGAVFVKIVLRSLKYDIPIAFAAGALMAGRLAGLALVQAFPDLHGHAIPGFSAYGIFSSFPTLVLSVWLVQISAGRMRRIVY
jgi:uncharacterized membrane protein YeaQ/YmgE (transglycosylase-associated protein family)